MMLEDYDHAKFHRFLRGTELLKTFLSQRLAFLQQAEEQNKKIQIKD